VTTFAFFASKNAEKYYVRAESYLKPGDSLRFDVILIRKSRRSKLRLADVGAPYSAARLPVPYIVFASMMKRLADPSSRHHADVQRVKCVYYLLFCQSAHKTGSHAKAGISIFAEIAKSLHVRPSKSNRSHYFPDF